MKLFQWDGANVGDERLKDAFILHKSAEFENTVDETNVGFALLVMKIKFYNSATKQIKQLAALRGELSNVEINDQSRR